MTSKELDKQIRDRIYVSFSYEQAVFALNDLQFRASEPMSSDYNKKISALRHRIHVALGEWEKSNE